MEAEPETMKSPDKEVGKVGQADFTGFGSKPGVGSAVWKKQGGEICADILLELGIWEQVWAWVGNVFTSLGRIPQIPQGIC